MERNKVNNTSSILVIVMGLCVFELLFKNGIFIRTGVGIGILSLLSKKIESLIVYLWFKLAFVLGFINSKILLSLVFYVFLVPLATLKKIFSSENSLKLKKPETSLWIHRDHEYEKGDITEPF